MDMPPKQAVIGFLVLIAIGSVGVAASPDLSEDAFGLWFAAVTSSTAGGLTSYGAMRGVIAHRFPRVLLAVATVFVAVSYWLDIVDGGGIGEDMRRGAALLLWPSLAWTAWSGVVYGKKAVTAMQYASEDDM